MGGEGCIVAVVTFEAPDVDVGTPELLVLDLGADLSQASQDRLPGGAVENRVRWHHHGLRAAAQRLPDRHTLAHALLTSALGAIEDALRLLSVTDDQRAASQPWLSLHLDGAREPRNQDKRDPHRAAPLLRAGSEYRRNYSTNVLITAPEARPVSWRVQEIHQIADSSRVVWSGGRDSNSRQPAWKL